MREVISPRLMTAAWLCVGVLAACGGGGSSSSPAVVAPPPGPGASAPVSPFVLNTSQPADQATGVAEDTAILLEFSTDVAAARATSQSVRLSTRDGDVSATLQAGGRTLRITPTLRLAPKEQHTITLSTAMGDTGGNALRQATEVRFTTGGASWQPAVFARAGNCTVAADGAALLDDGTLLLSCYNSLSPDTAIQRRDPSGQWQAPLAAPPAPATSVLGAPSLRKLSGQRVLASWITSSGVSALSRIYDTSSGWGPVLSPPVPAAQAGAVDEYSTLGDDGLLFRTRPLLQSEVPAGTTLSFEKVYELLSVNTGTPVASLRSESGRGAVAGRGCQFLNGDRLYLHATRSAQPIATNLYQWKLQATFYGANTGWSATTLLDTFSELTFTFKPTCAANGVARVFWSNQAGTIARYADWNSAQGWQAAQNISSTNQLVRATVVVSANGTDGSAFSTWSDFRLDPNGSVLEGTTPITHYARVPRLSEVSTTSPTWVPVLGLPLYEAGATHDTQVVDIAYNPGSGRYVALGWGGLTGGGKIFFTDYSHALGWSTPWTAPATSAAQGFVPGKLLFNTRGQGVALGLVNGQTYLSEWH